MPGSSTPQRYTHRFTVRAPLDQVAAFHGRSASMAAITPPPVIVQLHRAPEALADGAEMEFTLWMGPLPLRWLARIEEVTPIGFVDRMLRGPFRRWDHQHIFLPVDANQTEVIDDLRIEVSDRPFWRFVGRGMVLSLPLLFGYRGWKTRRILERGSEVGRARLAHGQAR